MSDFDSQSDRDKLKDEIGMLVLLSGLLSALPSFYGAIESGASHEEVVGYYNSLIAQLERLSTKFRSMIRHRHDERADLARLSELCDSINEDVDKVNSISSLPERAEAIAPLMREPDWQGKRASLQQMREATDRKLVQLRAELQNLGG